MTPAHVANQEILQSARTLDLLSSYDCIIEDGPASDSADRIKKSVGQQAEALCLGECTAFY